VTKNRIAPTRSTCAVVVSSQNANRDWLYYQQQTVSAEGFSGFGFSNLLSAHGPRKETKNCTDWPTFRRVATTMLDGATTHAGHEPGQLHGPLHLRRRGSKWFFGRDGGGARRSAAVFGSDLHKLVYPRNYDKFVSKHRESKNRIVMQATRSWTYSCAVNTFTQRWARAVFVSSTWPTSTTRTFPRR